MPPSKRKGKIALRASPSGDKSVPSTRSSSQSYRHQADRKQDKGSKPKTIETNVESETYFDSDEEEGDLNRVGRVPMSFYENENHIGYTAEGKKLVQELDSTEIGKLLFHSSNPDAWRTIVDVKNNRMIRLTDDDLKIISRIRKNMYPKENYNQEDLYIEFDNEDSIHPVSYKPPKKANFLPSKFEAAKIKRLVELIRSGKLVVKEKDEHVEDEIVDIWGDNIYQVDPMTGRRGRKHEITPPKIPLPTHSESYNPPEEYLLDEEEEKEWMETPPEERKVNYLPQQFDCLRKVGSYANLIVERFRRCQQLYMFPRAVKLKMNVDPESLYPKLPDINTLKPFPTRTSIEYRVSGTRKIAVDASGYWVALASGDKVSISSLLNGRIFDIVEGFENVYDLLWHPKYPLLIVSHGVTLSFVPILLPNMKGHEESDDNASENIYTKAKDLIALDSASAPWKHSKHGKYTGLSVDHVDDIKHIAVHPQGNYIVGISPHCREAANQCVIYCLSKKSFIRVANKMSNNSIRMALFHPTEPKLILGLRKGIRLFNLKVKNERLETEGEKLKGVDFPVSMHLNSNSQILSVANENGSVAIFDLNVGTYPYKKLLYQEERLIKVEFHKTLPLMLVASSTGVVHVIHISTSDDLTKDPLIVPLKDLKTHRVTDAVWHNNEPWLLTADDKKSMMWA
ncbi:WD repeat BOP1/Erb1 [Babesia gibsoni]|uniref:WD repeat BOP1/Erb1 n=1 Tax=Babesia gibsoni TaxID=33632 RepID=A0AAD8PGK4_BABGI|nr:WD repeat BOP1/Erb1 [Babesia gibsoni]